MLIDPFGRDTRGENISIRLTQSKGQRRHGPAKHRKRGNYTVVKHTERVHTHCVHLIRHSGETEGDKCLIARCSLSPGPSPSSFIFLKLYSSLVLARSTRLQNA